MTGPWVRPSGCDPSRRSSPMVESRANSARTARSKPRHSSESAPKTCVTTVRRWNGGFGLDPSVEVDEEPRPLRQAGEVEIVAMHPEVVERGYGEGDRAVMQHRRRLPPRQEASPLARPFVAD